MPTLVVNALNDPFLPARFLACPQEVSPCVTLDYPAQGGHVGFATGLPPGELSWLPERALRHFEQHTGPVVVQSAAAGAAALESS